MNGNLTPRQQRMLDYIRQYQAEHQSVPAMREIADACADPRPLSTSVVAYNLHRLQQMGLVAGIVRGTGKGKARAYRLVPGDELRIVLPAGLRPDQRCAAEDRLRLALVEYMEDQR